MTPPPETHPDTPLDRAARAAAATDAPADAQARFYALLLETGLCVPVRPAGPDDAIRPQVFALSEGDAALAFDDDARMAAFFEGPTEYVALSGRALASLLADAGLGLGLNLGDGPSAMLLEAATVRWLAAEMGGALRADAAAAATVAPPRGAEPALAAALAERLASFPGMIAEAWLVRLEGGAEPGLTVALRLAPTAARATEALAAALGRAAAPFAPAGETVAVTALEETAPLLAAARRLGAPLHAPPAPDAPARPAAAPKPPRPPKLR